MAAVACLVACGGDKDSDGNGGGDDESVPARANDRIAWNQVAESVGQLRSLTFLIYVDGVANQLSEPRCVETVGALGYECSGGLPQMSLGRHLLELTSRLNGVESPRSSALVITLTTASQTTIAVATPSDVAAASVDETLSREVACIGPSECYSIRAIAVGLDTPTALSPTPDGRLFFIESGTRVRVIDHDRLAPAPALTSPNAQGQIVGLAIDTQFATSHSTFVAWTEESASQGPRLNISRYRELQNALGEGATIVTGLRFAAGGIAPLAVDAGGLLYAALPAATTRDSGALAESGAVLRFTRDGLVPGVNPRGSTVIAEGYTRPTALAIDDAGKRVWIAGHRSEWPHVVATFSMADIADRSWPIRPEATLAAPSDTNPLEPTLGLMGPAASGAERWLVVGSNRQLQRRALDNQSAPFDAVEFTTTLPVLSAAQGPQGSWYVVAGKDEHSASILRLTPR